MTWIYVSIGLGVGGLAVLAVTGARVVAAARRLNRQIAQVHAQFSTKEDARG
ncbi:hypothetical protein [Nonomuraea phyllanthi]|uniref:hypothetical protein n=1 Tax=Nonomuraea phyllanthi TaxID=2219224 RepID=UPI001293436E|nr:hypothetical protein [Nonomuraea phyllanthi]